MPHLTHVDFVLELARRSAALGKDAHAIAKGLLVDRA